MCPSRAVTPRTLACEEVSMLIYNIYAYVSESDGTPYYIGKGCKNRAYSSSHTVSIPMDKRYIVIMEKNLTNIGALA